MRILFIIAETTIGNEMSPSLKSGLCRMPTFSRLVRLHLLSRIVLNAFFIVGLVVVIIFVIDFNIKPYSSVAIKKDIICSDSTNVIYFPNNVTAMYCENGNSDIIFKFKNVSRTLSIPELQSIYLKLTSSINIPLSHRFEVENDSIIIDSLITLKPWSNYDFDYFLNTLKQLARM